MSFFFSNVSFNGFEQRQRTLRFCYTQRPWPLLIASEETLLGIRTTAEATVAQLLSKAVRQERGVIVPALTFLLLFVSRQKVKYEN